MKVRGRMVVLGVDRWPPCADVVALGALRFDLACVQIVQILADPRTL
jgi:hypothetical protein